MDPKSTRRSIFLLLIVAATGVVISHIASAARLYEPYLYKPESWPKTRPEPQPSHGDNDRSRWATIRALVDHGTFAIGKREDDPQSEKKYKDSGIITESGWVTIDKVLHPDRKEFYSSKPPLLPILAACEYYLLNRAFGLSISTDPDRWTVMRVILFTFNGIPWFFYLLFLSRLLEQHGTTEWGQMFVLVAACFGTFVSTFTITLNNHTVAAYSALFALYAVSAIMTGGGCTRAYLAAGLFAGFTAVNELPAAALAATVILLLLTQSPKRTLLLTVPACAIVVFLYLLSNYMAIGVWTPAYDKFGTEWYEYEGSVWKYDPEKSKGIDWAYLKQSRLVYAFHVLIGHHGWLSLSPIYLFTLAGMLGSLRNPKRNWLGIMTLALTTVVISFYIVGVNDRNRNYGGWTNGLRWLIWLTPLWLLSMLPIVDWLGQRRWGRALAYACLGVSVFSVSYRPWNPWRLTWIYSIMESRGWIDY